VDASADGHHFGEVFRGEFVEEFGIGFKCSRSGDRLAGPTRALSHSGCGAALAVSELSSFSFFFAALFAEFA
jgi:hypothetical protein